MTGCIRCLILNLWNERECLREFWVPTFFIARTFHSTLIRMAIFNTVAKLELKRLKVGLGISDSRGSLSSYLHFGGGGGDVNLYCVP